MLDISSVHKRDQVISASPVSLIPVTKPAEIHKVKLGNQNEKLTIPTRPTRGFPARGETEMREGRSFNLTRPHDHQDEDQCSSVPHEGIRYI